MAFGGYAAEGSAYPLPAPRAEAIFAAAGGWSLPASEIHLRAGAGAAWTEQLLPLGDWVTGRGMQVGAWGVIAMPQTHTVGLSALRGRRAVISLDAGGLPLCGEPDSDQALLLRRVEVVP
ncbi:hypothetical protein [Vulgatibacter sp.]|uniref:hypothetical protein n=1 Tax=Vulgatibacter sp. TaxID=1971226 RepID=UPI00356A474B